MSSVAAVVLAAGRSRRMGRPKAWLTLAGEPLVVRAARLALLAGAEPVVVVAGTPAVRDSADPQAVRDVLAACLPPTSEARLMVVDGAPELDPLSSLRRGLAQLPEGAALLLWPVDCPFAELPLLCELTRLAAANPAGIATPTHGGRRGHPVVFGAAVVPELREGSLPEGARSVLARNAARLIAVVADDPRVCEDLDTPADAERLGVLVRLSSPC